MNGNEETEQGIGDASTAIRVNQGPPTQVSHPGRASWRTFFQTLVAFLPTANGIVLALQEFLAQPPYREMIPAWVYFVVNATVVLGAFLAKVVAQLMANPTVENWLQEHVPRASAQPRND